jgi:hypothetical protein
MPAWKPGQSGNPEGKAMQAALRKRLLAPAFDDKGNEIIEKDETSGKRRNVKKLELVADALIKRALKGDVQAINTCFDRIDGKPRQDIGLEPTDAFTELLQALAGTSRGLPPKPNGHASNGATNGTTNGHDKP